jgi:hypothetical protein
VRRVSYTGILKVSNLFSSASVPGVNLSLYCAALALLIVTFGLSLANGST